MKNLSLIFTVATLLTMNVLAETHGGVVTANEQIKAVTTYATGSGGDLYRVLNVQKQNGSDLFTISYGGMNARGKENISDKEIVKATASTNEDGITTIKVEHVSGADFSN